MAGYDVTRQYEVMLLELIQRNATRLRLAKVTLGGSSGSQGGSGTPPGGYDGQLAQRYIAFDTTEAIISGSVGGSGSIPSLVDNLNRIRSNTFVFSNTTLPANVAATAQYGVRTYGSRDDHVHSILLGANMSWVSGSLTSAAGTVSGSGTTNRVAEWASSTTLQDSTLIKIGAGVLTLSSAGAYTATVPETMILAGRNVANTFTTTQTIYAVQPELWLDGSGVPLRSVVFATSGSGRWYLRANNTAESGANAGSDFVILARNDSGGAIGTALTITRSNMAAAFAGNLSTSLSTNGALIVSVNNANAGASASARFRATSDVVTADYTAYPTAASGGARLNLTATGGYMLIGTTTNDRIDFYSNNTLRMTVAADGTLTVSQTVAGLARSNFLNPSDNAARRTDIKIGTGSAGTEALYFGIDQATSSYLDNRSGKDLQFQVNGTAKVTFGTSGAVGLANKITTYNGVATEGHGIAAIVDDVVFTARTSDIGSTNFTNAGVAGTYRVNYYMQTNNVDGTAGGVTLTIAYTDDTNARTVTTTSMTLAAADAKSGVIFVRLGSGSVAYSTAHTGLFQTASFNLYMTCERLS